MPGRNQSRTIILFGSVFGLIGTMLTASGIAERQVSATIAGILLILPSAAGFRYLTQSGTDRLPESNI